MNEKELNRWLKEWFKLNKDKFKIISQSNRNFLSRNIIANTIKSNLCEAKRWKISRPRKKKAGFEKAKSNPKFGNKENLIKTVPQKPPEPPKIPSNMDF